MSFTGAGASPDTYRRPREGLCCIWEKAELLPSSYYEVCEGVMRARASSPGTIVPSRVLGSSPP